MSKLTKAEVQETADDVEDGEIDIDDEDYGFLIDREGNLKTMFLPHDITRDTKIPASVKKIMKIFKIHDIEQLDAGMLH
jgi:hypothetical protein